MTEKPDIRYKKTAPTKKIISKAGFSHYKSLYKRKKTNTEVVTTYAEFNLIARTLFKNIGKAIVEKSGGVFMRGLGYFCVWMQPVKNNGASILSKRAGRKVSFMNFDEPYAYNLHLFADFRSVKEIKGWSMERAFHRNIRKGVSDNLYNFKPYTFHWSYIKRMFYK